MTNNELQTPPRRKIKNIHFVEKVFIQRSTSDQSVFRKHDCVAALRPWLYHLSCCRLSCSSCTFFQMVFFSFPFRPNCLLMLLMGDQMFRRPFRVCIRPQNPKPDDPHITVSTTHHSDFTFKMAKFPAQPSASGVALGPPHSDRASLFSMSYFGPFFRFFSDIQANKSQLKLKTSKISPFCSIGRYKCNSKQ